MKKMILLPLIMLGGLAVSINNSCSKENIMKPRLNLPKTDVDGFDEDNIKLTFFSFSDTHIGYGNDDVLFHNALKTVKDNYDIDLSVCCGDITQDGKENSVKAFRSIYDAYYDVYTTPMALALGNHDTHWSGCMNPSGFYDALGNDFFARDLENETTARQGNRHLKVKGYHFLCVEMSTYGVNNNPISSATETWLKGELNSIVSENPNQFIFVMSHSPAKNTIVGSRSEDLSGDWGSSIQLRNIFANYPQVVHLSGHTHYFNQNDQFISSNGDFLSIGVPSTCDITYNSLGDETWSDGDLGSVPSNSRTYSYGQIFEIDNNGNIKLTRIDFKNNSIVKTPIVIPHYDEEGTHLTVMSDAYRKEHNEAPYYDGDKTISAYYLGEKDIEIRYPSFKDDDSVFYYQITTKNADGILIKKITQISPWTIYPNPNDIPEILTYRLKNVALSGKFTIEVVAYDQWDVPSEPLLVTIERDISMDRLMAENLTLRILDLTLLDEVTLDYLDEIREIRELYDSYDYLIQQYVTNYSKFVKLETDFYNKYFINDDLTKYELDISKVYSNAPVPSRGKFSKGTYGGVSFIYESATTNNSIGINRGYFLDTLHISLTNTIFDSNDKCLGFILDNDVQVNYEKDKNMMLVIDFADGGIYMAQGEILMPIGQTNLLKYQTLNHTPWEMKFNKVDIGYNVNFKTVNGEYSTLINDSYFANLTSYINVDNTFIEITPVGTHISASIDVLSIHHRNCVNNELDVAIKNGLDELDAYYNSLDLSKYSEDNQARITSWYEDAKEAIRNASSIEEINSIINQYKENVTALPFIDNGNNGDDSNNKNNKKKGCKGSFVATSIIVSITSILGLAISLKKRKED